MVFVVEFVWIKKGKRLTNTTLQAFLQWSKIDCFVSAEKIGKPPPLIVKFCAVTISNSIDFLPKCFIQFSGFLLLANFYITFLHSLPSVKEIRLKKISSLVSLFRPYLTLSKTLNNQTSMSLTALFMLWILQDRRKAGCVGVWLSTRKTTLTQLWSASLTLSTTILDSSDRLRVQVCWYIVYLGIRVEPIRKTWSAE